ncbi:hypothetical protein ABIC63_005941 [Pseudacidovorax sp. 1753]
MMTLKTEPGIPKSVKLFAWLLIAAGSFFFYVYTFNPGIIFPASDLNTYSAKLGFGSTGVRILGAVLALLISVLANNSRWLFITLVCRIFVEAGDIAVGYVLDGVTKNTYALIILVGFEVWAVVKIWKAK